MTGDYRGSLSIYMILDCMMSSWMLRIKLGSWKNEDLGKDEILENDVTCLCIGNTWSCTFNDE